MDRNVMPLRRRHDKLAEGLAIGLLLNGVTGFDDNPTHVRAAFETAFNNWSSGAGHHELGNGVPTILAGIAMSSTREHVAARFLPDGKTRRIRVIQVPVDTNHRHRRELASLIHMYVTADDWMNLASKFITALETPQAAGRHAAGAAA